MFQTEALTNSDANKQENTAESDASIPLQANTSKHAGRSSPENLKQTSPTRLSLARNEETHDPAQTIRGNDRNQNREAELMCLAKTQKSRD